MPATPSRKKSATPAPTKATWKAAKPALKAPKAQGMGPRSHMDGHEGQPADQVGQDVRAVGRGRSQGPPDVTALVAWLKEKGLGTVVATMVAHHVHGGYMKEHEDPTALLEGNFAGEKAALRPVYEALSYATLNSTQEASIDLRPTSIQRQDRP